MEKVRKPSEEIKQSPRGPLIEDHSYEAILEDDDAYQEPQTVVKEDFIRASGKNQWEYASFSPGPNPTELIPKTTNSWTSG